MKSDRPKGFVDYTGFKSGKVTVLGFDSWHYQPSGQRKSKWECQCECGNKFVAMGSNLRKEGHTTSCGCVKVETILKHHENVKTGKWVPEKLVGKRFGRLTVESFKEWDQTTTCRVSVWNTICDCGNEHETRRSNLQDYSSCGCWRSEKMSEAQKKHGMTGTPEYVSWQKMKERCYLDSYEDKAYYQDRGIEVCPEWLGSFEKFYEDMGPRPEGMTLDRIDFDLGYFKENCRWADLTIQAYNRRMGSNNSSGRVGVYQLPNGNWKAAITYYKESSVLAYDVDFETAVAARRKAEIELYGQTKD